MSEKNKFIIRGKKKPEPEKYVYVRPNLVDISGREREVIRQFVFPVINTCYKSHIIGEMSRKKAGLNEEGITSRVESTMIMLKRKDGMSREEYSDLIDCVNLFRNLRKPERRVMVKQLIVEYEDYTRDDINGWKRQVIEYHQENPHICNENSIG